MSRHYTSPTVYTSKLIYEMKQSLPLLLLILLMSNQLFAQGGTFTTNVPQPNLTEIQNYQDYKNQTQREDKEESLVLYFYPCINGRIDLRDFKKRDQAKQAGIHIPDFKKVTFPTLATSKDTVYAVGLMNSRIAGKGMVHVILISGYHTADPIYYIDENADGDYRNDQPFSFQSRKNKTYHAKVQTADKHIYEFSLYSKQQVYKAKAKQERLSRPERTFSEKHFVNNSLYASFGLTTGNGRISYDFRDTDTDYPTTYTSNYFPIGVAATVSYSYARFSLGAELRTGLMNNYSSQRHIQVLPLTADNPYLLESNHDGRPSNFLNYGLTLSYNIKTASIVSISPEIGIFKTSFLGDSYAPNRRKAPDETFEYNNKPFVSMGIAGKLALNQRSLFFIKARYEVDRFEPNGYFESLNTRTVNSNHFRVVFDLGLQWRLDKGAKTEE